MGQVLFPGLRTNVSALVGRIQPSPFPGTASRCCRSSTGAVSHSNCHMPADSRWEKSGLAGGNAPVGWEHSPATTPAESRHSPFWVSFVEQTSVEIWKLSRADTVKPDVPPLTRKEEPDRSFGSDRFLVEGKVRYALASSSFLLSPCKAEHGSHRAARRGTGLARGFGLDPPHQVPCIGGLCCAEWGRARRPAEPHTGNGGSHLTTSLRLGKVRLTGVAGMRELAQGNCCPRCRALCRQRSGLAQH